MNGLLRTIGTINSLARTTIAGVLVGLMAMGAWFGYSNYNAGERERLQTQQELTSLQSSLETANRELSDKVALLQQREQEIAQLQQRNALQAAEIEHLNTAMRLLKVDRRLAQIRVVNQQPDDSGQLVTDIRFVEVNDQGQPIDAPRDFRIRGDVVYIDYWVVKFDDAYIEQSDLDRSTSICLFRRVFGEFQEPQDGYVLDDVGSRPKAYGRNGPLSDFERQIWRDFWEFANEPQKAAALGIRAAHGEAVSVKLRPGKQYRVQLRASDGLSITPEEEPSPVPDKPTA